jgi:hypothetical protein
MSWPPNYIGLPYIYVTKLMLFTENGMLVKPSQSNLTMNTLPKMIVVSAIRGFGRQKSQSKEKLLCG